MARAPTTPVPRFGFRSRLKRRWQTFRNFFGRPFRLIKGVFVTAIKKPQFVLVALSILLQAAVATVTVGATGNAFYLLVLLPALREMVDAIMLHGEIPQDWSCLKGY